MTRGEWIKEAKDHLLGKTITKVSYMDKKTADEIGFHHQPVVFCLDDETWCFPMMDDEGNDAGALAVGEGGTLPVLRD
jgi:hypothetical protein